MMKEKISKEEERTSNPQTEKLLSKKKEASSLEFVKNSRNGKIYKKGKETIEILKSGQSNITLDDKNIIECDLSLSEDSEGYLTNDKNHFKARFGKSICDNEVTSLERSGHILSMRYLSGNQRMGGTTKRSLTKSAKLDSKLRYENVENGIDFEYELTQTGVKESIVVKQKQEEYSYHFDLNIGSLTPKYDGESKTLELQANGHAIYRLKSPYMLDANGDVSNDCSYEMKEDAAGSLAVALRANKEWIDDDNRKLPVIIDPTIEVVSDRAFTITGRIEVPGGSVDDPTSFRVGGVETSSGRTIYKTYITIDILKIIDEIGIKPFKAYLNLHVKNTTPFFEANGRLVFSSGNIVLTKLDSLKTADAVTVDVSAILNNYSGSDIVISYEDDTVSPLGAIQEPSVLTFEAFDGQGEEKIPQLELIYSDEELDRQKAPSKDYSSGIGGTTSVNLLDGFYKHTHGDASILQNSLSINLSHVFNSEEFKDLKKEIKPAYLGKGWKTNLHQYLLKDESFNQLLGSEDIAYYDGDGNKRLLHEQWYYFDENKIKRFVAREDIYLDSDQKIKYTLDENHIYEVKREVKNDDGLTYVSGSSGTLPLKKGKTVRYYAMFGLEKKYISIEGNDIHHYFQYYYMNEDDKVYVLPSSLRKNDKGILVGGTDKSLFVDLTSPCIIEKVSDKFGFYCKQTQFHGQPDVADSNTATIFVGLESELVDVEDTIIDDIYQSDEIKQISNSIESVKRHLIELDYSKNSIIKDYLSLLDQYKFSDYLTARQNAMIKIQKKLKRQQDDLVDQVNGVYRQKIDDARTLFDLAIRQLKTSGHFTLSDDFECSKLDDYSDEGGECSSSTALSAISYLNQKKNVDITSSADYKKDAKEYEDIGDQVQKERSDFDFTSLNEQLLQYETEYARIVDSIKSYTDNLQQLQTQKQALIDDQKKNVNDFIVDKEGNTLGFDGYGRLVLIQDKFENKIRVGFGYEDESAGKMLAIYSDSQTIKFNYDKISGLLSSLIDHQGRKTKYEYEDGNLVSIVYPDKKKTAFNYDDGHFKVTSPLLETVEIFKSEDSTLKARTYCLKTTMDEEGNYENVFDKNTCLSGAEPIELSAEDFYIFDETFRRTVVRDRLKANDDGLEELDVDTVCSFDLIGRVIETHNEYSESVSFYENKKLKSEASFLKDEEKSVLDHLTVYEGSHTYQIRLDKYKTADENKLPISNMLGLKLKVLTGNIDNDSILSFKVIIGVESITKDGALVSESFEQTYQEVKLQTLVLPICVDRNLSYRLDIVIQSLSDDFNSGTYFDSVDLIKLEEGKIYSYDDKGRLIKEQDGYTSVCCEDFSEDDIPLIKIESNIYGEAVTTHYSYNANKQITLVEDSKQNVEECFYDELGNCIEKRTYNKKDASLMKVERQSFDEYGRPSSTRGCIKNELGEYPKEEVTYLPGTNTQNRVKGPNGESTGYQYDSNTGDLLSISSSAAGINNSTSFTYNYGLLTSMSHHGMKVDYVYDGRGRRLKTALNDEDVVWNQYQDNYDSNNDTEYPYEEQIKNGSKVSSTTVEGLYVASYQNEKGQPLHVDYSGDDSFGKTTYQYVDDKAISVTSASTYRDTDETYQEEQLNTYDEFEELVKQEKRVDEVSEVILEDHYDENHRFIQSSDVILSKDEYRLNTLNEYDGEHQLKTIRLREGIVGEEKEEDFLPIATTDLDYDVLGRVTHQDLSAKNFNLCHEYSYLQQDENTLDLIAEDIAKIKITNGSNTTYLTETAAYQYDVSGNIISIDTDETKTRYQYDKLNRLVREDNPVLNKTTVYKYDKAGNILLQKRYPYSLDDNLFSPNVKEYVYGWEKGRDRLISFDGKSIEYNKNSIGGKMGYPTTYKNDEFEWNNQGQLTYILNQNMDEIEYFYDTEGIRRKKIVNGVETSFITDGTRILSAKRGDTALVFRYVLNKLTGFCYTTNSSSKEYLYQRNIQGDIIGIFDDDGNKAGGYAYDAYGNCDVALDVDGIAALNPFRYRGYFFDNETKLYYLNARYYDPEAGRLISPDVLSVLDESKGQINGLNLYMYCADNPVMHIDPSGYAWWNPFSWDWGKIISVTGAILIVGGLAVASILTSGTLAVVLTGAAIGGAVSAVSQYVANGSINYEQLFLDIGVGAISTFAGTTGINRFGSALIGGLIGGASSIFSDLMTGRSINWAKIGVSIGIGVIVGLISGPGAKNKKALDRFASSKNPKIGQYRNTVNRMNANTVKITSQTYRASIKSMEGRINNSISAYIVSYGSSTIELCLKTLIFSTWAGTILGLSFQN